MLKGLSVAGLFLPLFLLLTCKELPTNPYNDVRNLKIGLFLSGNKVSAFAGDSVQVGVTVNIPKLVKSLKSIDGEENLERVLTLENPNTTNPDTVYFKTLYKTPGSKTITVKVMLTDDMPTEFPFEIAVLAAPGLNDPTVWKQDTLSISATENSVISKSLDSLLADKALADVSFGCNKGTISQRVWSDTIRWGAPAVDTVVITANYNNNAYPLKLFIRVLASDTSLPNIVLVDPSTADAMISSNVITCKFTITDSLSGIGSVVFRIGTTVLSDTLHSGDTYQCTVKDLPAGVKTIVTVEAVDRSQSKNAALKEISLTYNPDMQDNVRPVISLKNPLVASFSVSTAETTIQLQCTDQSGIMSVTAMKGSTALTVQKADSVYSIAVTSLVAGKTDTIVVTAIDSSAAANSSTLPIYIKYDPTATDVTGPVIKLSNPSQDRSKVAQASVKLVVVCKDDNGIGAVSYTFGTVNGAMTKDNDSTFSVALANLVQGDNQITILATDASSKKNTNDTVFTIVYDPTMNDNAAPVITLKTPEKDSAKVSSKSITVEVVCTDASGIDTVTCKMGTSDVPVVKGTGGVYSATVTTLAVGANTFTFTATDKASTKHSESKTVTVIYDPSMIDNVPPTVTIKNPQNADQRVFADTITIQIDCSDDNNIASVTATRAGAAVTGITNAGSLYSVKVTGLTAGKSDTINFKVIDNSSNKVAKDFPVILRYNRNPIAATLGTPADGATGVAKSPTFTWTGGTDPDGDAVTYTLRYGTSETALTKTVPNLTAGTTTLATALSGAIKYYWQVVTYTAVNGDSAVSKIASFTTVEDAPVIEAEPETKRTIVGGAATFSVTAKGSNLKFQWQKGTSNVTTGTGAATATYTTTAGSGDNGSTYRCIVTNSGGADTSLPATLILLYGVTYNANGSTSGTVPTDDATYASGDQVTVKTNSGSLARTGYTFAGWNSKSDGTGTSYTPGSGKFTMSSGDAIIYAKWTLESYSITYTVDGAAYSGTPANYNIESTTFNLSTPTKTGYLFSGWYGSSDLSGSKITSITKGTTGNKAFFAKWTPESYSITYTLDGAAYSGTPTSYTIETETFSLPTPTKSGSVFSGWYGTSDLSGSQITSIAKGSTGNKSFYGKWSVTYSVTYDANGGSGTVPVDSKPYAANSNVTVLTGNLTKTAFVFDGWSRTKNYKASDSPVTSFTIENQDVVLYARWIVVDYDGNKYDAVTIGSQTWLVQNLRTTRLRNGGSIYNAINSEEWVYRGENDATAYCWPHNSVTEGQTYGALYNWKAATTSNLAPAGWHVPTNEEYEQLIAYVDKDCKVLIATSANPAATNSTGFTAIPTPIRDNSGEFSSVAASYMMWSSDPGVWYLWLDASSSWLPAQMWNYTTKVYGYPIRLIKD